LLDLLLVDSNAPNDSDLAHREWIDGIGGRHRSGSNLRPGLSGVPAHLRKGQVYECRYTSLEQCAMSASGRPAQCVINPYPGKAALTGKRPRPTY